MPITTCQAAGGPLTGIPVVVRKPDRLSLAAQVGYHESLALGCSRWVSGLKGHEEGHSEATGFGVLLRAYRLRAKLTQNDLAGRAGVSLAAIRDLEQGRTAFPRQGSLRRLATALALTDGEATEFVRSGRAHASAADADGWPGSARPRFRLQALGPLTAQREGVPLQLGPPRQRAVLGLLALNPGVLVHRDKIIDTLWHGCHAPDTAVNLVQTYVSRLRRALGSGAHDGKAYLTTIGGGYQLQISATEFDLLAFHYHVRDARAKSSAADLASACDLYETALTLWRGDPLADVDVLRGNPAVAALCAQHTAVVLEYARTASDAGWHDRVLPVLQSLAAQEPLNEKAHAQLMIALAGSGQQSAALQVYEDLRARLDNQLGVLPSVELSSAHLRVLRQDVPASDRAPTIREIRTVERPVRDRGQAPAASTRSDVTRRPAQLPVAPTGFVGRASEQGRVCELLAGEDGGTAPRIVAIDGPPGVGKTALALRCAHIVNGSDPQPYCDGELYANLHGYSGERRPAAPADVLEEFLVALGISPRDVPAGAERRATLYRSLLASRRVLVILDNAASSAQIEPLLPGSPRCGVVVTSRRRLVGLAMRVGAERVVLGPMSTQDSLGVLRAVIGAERAGTTPTELATLADQCGRLPLALRIAAERVVVHPDRPVGELVNELSAERSRLDGLRTDDSVAVRTTFEWSYRELSDAESHMFRLLGLHRGPHFGTHAAAALAGITTLHASRLLEKLASVHLLEGIPGNRLHFHDLLRVYAAERGAAEETGTDLGVAARRLADWYLHTTAAAGQALAPFRLNPLQLPAAPEVPPLVFSSASTALAWCDTEAPNLVSIIRLAIDYRLYDRAWKLAVALFDYLRLLRQPGLFWLATTSLAREAARAAGDLYAEGWVETSLAEGYRWLRQYRRSQNLFQHALTVRQEIGDRHGEAWALAGLGFLAIDQGLLTQAHEYAQKALPIFRAVCDRHGEASALFTVADAYHGWQRIDEALDVLANSRRIFEEIQNHDGLGLTTAKMADLHIARGDHEVALACLDQSLAARRVAGAVWGEADGLVRRARVLQVLGRVEEARQSWETALTLYEETDSPQAAHIRAHLRGKPTPLEDALPPPGW